MPSRSFTLLAAVVSGTSLTSSAEAIEFYGGPGYDVPTKTGHLWPSVPHQPGKSLGGTAAVGAAQLNVNGLNLGYRAFRLDPSGVTFLGNINTNETGFSNSFAYAVNAAGLTVGAVDSYIGNINQNYRAVRWEPNSTTPTPLGRIPGDNAGSLAFAVNSGGTAVGYGDHFINGQSVGERAIRWDATTLAATELGSLGTNAGGWSAGSRASDLNDAGTAVGYAHDYSGPGVTSRAVRWDANATAATRLGTLGDGASADDRAVAINASGTAVGYAQKVGLTTFGHRAVRWNANTTVATELGALGTDENGRTDSQAVDVNDSGVAVGYARKYDGNVSYGERAVRWNNTPVAPAVELEVLSDGWGTSSYAYAINNNGITVGRSDANLGGWEGHAVAWDAAGKVTDLNTLLSPADAGQWVLNEAYSITDTNWVSGVGRYFPDGRGGLYGSYIRSFLIQVPEPTALGGAVVAGALVLRRRRRA